jgi:hypothetical protein
MLQGWLIKLATTKKRSRSLTDFGSDRISLLVRVEPEDGPISTCARVSSERSPGGDCHLLWVGRRTASGERFNPAGMTDAPPMWSENKEGEPVPIAGNAERPVPNARRNVARRTEG